MLHRSVSCAASTSRVPLDSLAVILRSEIYEAWHFQPEQFRGKAPRRSFFLRVVFCPKADSRARRRIRDVQLLRGIPQANEKIDSYGSVAVPRPRPDRSILLPADTANH